MFGTTRMKTNLSNVKMVASIISFTTIWTTITCFLCHYKKTIICSYKNRLKKNIKGIVCLSMVLDGKQSSKLKKICGKFFSSSKQIIKILKL